MLLTTHASRYSVGHATDALSEHLSLQASPSRGGALGFFMVGVGCFVFLHGLPENRVDFFEMLDAFAEFSRFSHQHSVASLQFPKAQAQRFLLVAPARGMGRALASLPLKLFERRVETPGGL